MSLDCISEKGYRFNEVQISYVCARMLQVIPELAESSRYLHPSALYFSPTGQLEVKLSSHHDGGNDCSSGIYLHWSSPELASAWMQNKKNHLDSEPLPSAASVHVWSVGVAALQMALGSSPRAHLQGETLCRYLVSGKAPRLPSSFIPPSTSMQRSLASSSSPASPKLDTVTPTQCWSSSFSDFLSLVLQKLPMARAPVADLLKHPFINMHATWGVKGTSDSEKTRNIALETMLLGPLPTSTAIVGVNDNNENDGDTNKTDSSKSSQGVAPEKASGNNSQQLKRNKNRKKKRKNNRKKNKSNGASNVNSHVSSLSSQQTPQLSISKEHVEAETVAVAVEEAEATKDNEKGRGKENKDNNSKTILMQDGQNNDPSKRIDARNGTTALPVEQNSNSSSVSIAKTENPRVGTTSSTTAANTGHNANHLENQNENISRIEAATKATVNTASTNPFANAIAHKAATSSAAGNPFGRHVTSSLSSPSASLASSQYADARDVPQSQSTAAPSSSSSCSSEDSSLFAANTDTGAHADTNTTRFIPPPPKHQQPSRPRPRQPQPPPPPPSTQHTAQQRRQQPPPPAIDRVPAPAQHHAQHSNVQAPAQTRRASASSSSFSSLDHQSRAYTHSASSVSSIPPPPSSRLPSQTQAQAQSQSQSQSFTHARAQSNTHTPGQRVQQEQNPASSSSSLSSTRPASAHYNSRIPPPPSRPHPRHNYPHTHTHTQQSHSHSHSHPPPPSLPRPVSSSTASSLANTPKSGTRRLQGHKGSGMHKPNNANGANNGAGNRRGPPPQPYRRAVSNNANNGSGTARHDPSDGRQTNKQNHVGAQHNNKSNLNNYNHNIPHNHNPVHQNSSKHNGGNPFNVNRKHHSTHNANAYNDRDNNKSTHHSHRKSHTRDGSASAGHPPVTLRRFFRGVVADPSKTFLNTSTPSPSSSSSSSIASSYTFVYRTAQVERRYSDFYWLYNRLVELYPQVLIPPIPKKQGMGRFKPDFVKKRQRALQWFLAKVSYSPVLSNCTEVATFLQADRKTWSKLRKKTSRSRSSSSSRSFPAGSGISSVSGVNASFTSTRSQLHQSQSQSHLRSSPSPSPNGHSSSSSAAAAAAYDPSRSKSKSLSNSRHNSNNNSNDNSRGHTTHNSHNNSHSSTAFNSRVNSRFSTPTPSLPTSPKQQQHATSSSSAFPSDRGNHSLPSQPSGGGGYHSNAGSKAFRRTVSHPSSSSIMASTAPVSRDHSYTHEHSPSADDARSVRSLSPPRRRERRNSITSSADSFFTSLFLSLSTSNPNDVFPLLAQNTNHQSSTDGLDYTKQIHRKYRGLHDLFKDVAVAQKKHEQAFAALGQLQRDQPPLVAQEQLGPHFAKFLLFFIPRYSEARLGECDSFKVLTLEPLDFYAKMSLACRRVLTNYRSQMTEIAKQQEIVWKEERDQEREEKRERERAEEREREREREREEGERRRKKERESEREWKENCASADANTTDGYQANTKNAFGGDEDKDESKQDSTHALSSSSSSSSQSQSQTQTQPSSSQHQRSSFSSPSAGQSHSYYPEVEEAARRTNEQFSHYKKMKAVDMENVVLNFVRVQIEQEKRKQRDLQELQRQLEEIDLMVDLI